MTKRVTIAVTAAAIVATGAAGSILVKRHLIARPSVYLGTVSKTADCKAVDGLPDRACTPGALFKSVTKNQICLPGYSKLVRHVDEQTKAEVFRRYGISNHDDKQYEVDHLVSLQLGGSNDIANLWPEAAKPQPGFHQKDIVENLLHDKVCKGEMTLQEAANQITTNWQVYLK